MIRIKDTTLTGKVLTDLFNEWKKDLSRLQLNDDMYTNKPKLKMPFAKKLVTISAAATIGDGITIAEGEEMSEPEKDTYQEIEKLFKKQNIHSHDAKLVRDMCRYGKAYELCYMSDDAVPVPKTTLYSPLNAFVIYDDTVENNSLWGVYFDCTQTDKGEIYSINIVDNEFKYYIDINADNLKKCNISLDGLEKVAHNMGRVPLTELKNNDEEQSDFEQLIDLMIDRTDIHNINLKDFKEIAKNYLKARNIKFAGITEKEKAESRRKAYDLQLIEVETDGVDAADDIGILSKVENYTSITEFGKDVDNKIYDLSMIPDLSAEQFAGNQTGVALKLKLMPFKELVKTKNGELEKAYRRRLKMYSYALSLRAYAEIDTADISISFNRSWWENELELAAFITQLQTTGLFSDEYLTNKLPDADYADEQSKIAVEREEKAKNQPQAFGFDNSQGADYLGGLRALQGGLNERL